MGEYVKSSRWLVVAEAAVWLAVLGSPLALGGVDPWVFLAVAALGALALGTAGVSRRHEGLPVPAAALALVGGTVLALLSALPLPAAVAHVLSPRAVALSSLSPEAARAFVPWSLDPPASLVDAVRLAGLAGLMLASASLARRHRTARRLTMAVALSGLAMTAFALVGALLGFEHLLASGARAPVPSPFVNPNHLASLAILAAAASFGLSRATAEPAARFGWQAGAFACAGLVVATQSHGGIASLVLAAALLAAFAGRHRNDVASPRRGPLAAIGLLVVGAVALVAIESALDQARDAETAAQGKTWPWPATLRLILAHPLTGVGGGAFASAFPAFAPPRTLPTITHPENLPLQWLAAWGIPAALAAFALLGATMWRVSSRRRDEGEESTAILDGLVAGCVAVLVHEASDFGLEYLGVGVPFVVALGAAAGRTGRHRRVGPVWAGVGAGGVVAVALVGGFYGLPHLVDGELAQLEATTASLDVPALDAAYREVRARHPSDPYVLLKEADVLLARASATSGPSRREALVRSLAPLARVQELEQSDVAHEVTARALWLLGRRAQAFGELRLAYATSGRPLAVLDEALAYGAGPEELAAFPEALALSVDEEPDRRAMFEPARASAAVVRFLLYERHRPALARLVAREILAAADPRLSSSDLLVAACDVAAYDGRCAKAAGAGCSPPGDVAGIASDLVQLGEAMKASNGTEAARCLAEGWRLRGDAGRATQILSDAIRADPANLRLRVVAAGQLLEDKRPAEAFQLLADMNESADPSLAYAMRHARVSALIAAGRTGRAVVEAQAAFDAHPKELWAPLLLASAFEANGELRPAVQALLSGERLAEGAQADEIRKGRTRLEQVLRQGKGPR